VRPDWQLVCLDLAGKPIWTSGNAHKFGTGPYMMAQGMIYLLDDDGTLTLAEATLDGYKQLSQAKVLQGHDAWGPMALAGSRLIVRDLNQMACLDVGAK
jgi:outer membrane protein assembly factor BamB